MKHSVDLVPPELRAKQHAQQRATGWVGVVAAVAAAVLFITLALRHQIKTNRDNIEPLRIHVEELRALEPRVLRARQELQLLTAGFKSAQSLLSEPDWIRRGVSRAEVSRITQIPLETVRRRINRLIEMGVLADRKDGVIVPETNRMAAASRRRKMHINTQLVERLISDLDARGVPLS